MSLLRHTCLISYELPSNSKITGGAREERLAMTIGEYHGKEK